MATETFELRNFINGEYVSSTSKDRLIITNPYNSQVVTDAVEVAGAAEVDAAVAAAQKAFKNGWKATPGAVRGGLLLKLADLMERDAAKIAHLEVLGSGNAFSMVAQRGFGAAMSALRHFAGWADKLEGQTLETNDGFYKIVRREPFGVVAGIAAYNATILYFAYKVGAAVAAGNCIIFKASEKTPLGAISLGALVKEAGFPPGVIQIVNGGRDTGALLASHVDIGLLSFTGSNPAGKKIQEAAAKSNLKKVILELGGKNPSIIFDDADIAKAVMWTTNGLLILQGQTCTAATNVFVQKGVVDEVIEKLKTSYAQFAHVLGKDPMDPTTIDGTLIDRGQFDRVLHLIDEAKKHGGEMLVGGQPIAGDKGPFQIQPTIFKNLSEDNPMYREEVFGPVINIIPFDTEEEAIELANDNVFGLAANVYTENLNRALRVSSAAEAGLVAINMPFFPVAGLPFGGWKQSGASFEGGHLGINEYTRVKTVMIAYS